VPKVAVTVAVNCTLTPNVDGLGAEATVVVVGTVFTVCVALAAVLASSPPLPLYWAPMVWVPVDIVDVVKVALPPLTVPIPAGPPSMLKVTVPEGVVPEGALTVAVKVTELPKIEGLGDRARVVVVVSCTACETAFEVLPAKVLSPL
jgi:hypothetical protein